MFTNTRDDSRPYRVMCNRKEQGALWPLAYSGLPDWHKAGQAGQRSGCLTSVNEDIRSLCVCRRMAARARLAERKTYVG
jgi:uncharacterized protein YbdZ (MbtH family)